MRGFPLIALVLIAALCPAYALESPPVVSERAQVSLVTETDGYRPGQTIRAGLRFRMTPGWHIYWRNPGDAGSPPDIAWALPPGASVSAIDWPAPRHEPHGPVISFVYTNEVVLPVRVAPPPGNGPLTIQADANWLVCQVDCIPEEGNFTLTLPAGAANPGPEAPLFAAADARRPEPWPYDASVSPDGSLHLSGAGLATDKVREAWFFPSAWGDVDQNAPQTLTRDSGGLTLRLRPGAQFAANRGLDGLLTLRAADGAERFYDLNAPPAGASVAEIARTLLLALAGGLILNLMPCVFPVLAMKALAIARLSGDARWSVQADSLSYTAGVLVAFLVLGFALLGFRATGAAFGWGFQFQSPVFVACMAWLLFAIGLNLSGVFEISGRFAGAGQSLVSRGGFVGSFATGLLAVVVSTPCTAPFMGGAIAASVTAPPAMAMGIFAALGLGLALPQLAFAAAPGLAGLLPKPGAWMRTLREVLAFSLYFATIWLVWVASQQSGPSGVLIVTLGLGFLGFGGWLLGKVQGAEGWRRRGGLAFAAVTALAAVALLPELNVPAPDIAVRSDLASQPFSDEALATARAAGRPVFIDMTAAWCVTCLVNERVALSPKEVRDAFAAHDVAYLRGDWTRRDPAITRFLLAAGHQGVPLYLFYPPHGEPVTLPLILSPSIVLAQLQPLPK